MNERIKAGADIHAGDGGYEIGTQEKYEAFVKIRNESLAQSRIRELAERAENYAHEQNDKFGLSYKREYDKKFAELIVQECANYVRTNLDSWDAEPLAFCMERDFGLHGDYAE